MSTHKTVVCTCGKRISTCRCAAPNKEIVISTEPCTHKTQQSVPMWTSERKMRLVGPTDAGTLRAFLDGLSDSATVRISQDRRTGYPTDPGGTVTITVEDSPKESQ